MGLTSLVLLSQELPYGLPVVHCLTTFMHFSFFWPVVTHGQQWKPRVIGVKQSWYYPGSSQGERKQGLSSSHL